MLSKRKLLRSLAVIIGSFSLGFLALWWLESDISAQAAKAQEIKVNIGQEADLIASYTTLKSDAEKARVYEQRLEGLLPPKDKLIDVDNFLEALASQRRVTTTFSFNGVGTRTGQGSLGSIGFNLQISGSLAGIYGLLEDIELKPKSYLLSLDDFSISKTDQGYELRAHGQLFYKEGD